MALELPPAVLAFFDQAVAQQDSWIEVLVNLYQGYAEAGMSDLECQGYTLMKAMQLPDGVAPVLLARAAIMLAKERKS